MLAVQIEEFKPDVIIFATGVHKVIDDAIKELFNTYFDGLIKNDASFITKKFWEFNAGGATCFRIAHPRAYYGHQKYRKLIIDRKRLIKQ
ncbi:hypothetical protein [Vibrio sp. MA40-2]|uniref:hypothetical protein n=1 Tax=Vibrio sp. MA40-2 TaxID=3391828 RepID=UPI0039A49CAA